MLCFRHAVFIAICLCISTTVAPASSETKPDPAHAAYLRAVAAAKKAGIPTTPAELKRPPIPASRNAAPFYRKLDALHKSRPLILEEEESIMILLGRRPPTPAEIEKARSVFAQRSDLTTLVHQAAARPDCDFQRDWTQMPYVPTPEYARMRAAARWLTGESGLMVREGKPLQAVNNMALGFRIARHTNTDMTLMSYLVAVAVDSITMRGLENILYEAGEKPGVADAVVKSIDKSWRPLSLSSGLRAEIWSMIRTMNIYRKGRDGDAALKSLQAGAPMDNPFVIPKKTRSLTPAEFKELNRLVDVNGATAIDGLRHIIAAADKPYPTALQNSKQVVSRLDNKRDAEHGFANMLVGLFGNSPTTRARDMARAAVLRAGAALLTWKGKHGSFPEKLGQAINPAPTDPFDLKPLRYRREGNGFVVYSIGETGTFNGAAIDAQSRARECFFRYPMPASWRQPARVGR
jgi:hypothetical protein